MNPTGYRLEEKKSADPEPSYPRRQNKSFDSKSQTSYRSTQSSRSSVLQRAREYTRRIEQTAAVKGPTPEDWERRRSKSLERKSTALSDAPSAYTARSQSAGRATQQQGARPSTRERALASVRKDDNNRKPSQQSRHSHSTAPSTPSQSQYTTSQFTSATSSVRPSTTVTPRTNTSHSSNNKSTLNSSRHSTHHSRTRGENSTTASKSMNESKGGPKSPHTVKSGTTAQSQSQPPQEQQQQHQAVVTPELLVDALSGHEDGLLAIAEKLMEHYDSGYDVMGEAIIDAFADVQKLFQHVVEAAHMEGAAFEASRREEELAELRQQVSMGGAGAADLIASGLVDDPNFLLNDTNGDNSKNTAPSTPNGPTRHDEFVDQDVKDILTEAIRKGGALRSENKHQECFELFEKACQDASSLLPVDSDHRGRLQLSIARAESMNPDRSCAILRYAMDDVLRSGMRAHRTPLPDPSKRADVVLNRPKGHPSLTGATGQVMAGVIQSSDEALASLIEEMKEILSAPIYDDTPLQSVSKRFWAALAEAQKSHQKNEERLEQNLAKLKVEFLLARAEWEEKLNKSNETAENFKTKYNKLKDSMKHDGYMEQARSFAQKLHTDGIHGGDDNDTSMYGSVRSGVSGKAGSVVSGVSGLAQQAKTIVSQMNNFNCTALNERNGSAIDEDGEISPRNLSVGIESRQSKNQQHGANTHDKSAGRSKASRSLKEYSKSPKRGLDI